jgi:hypothetical protein
MYQRIQTVFYLIAALCCFLLPLWLPLWENSEGKMIWTENEMLPLALFVAAGLLNFIAVFIFKSRKVQVVLGRLAILIIFVLLGFFVYWSLMVPGEMDISEKGIGMLIPVVPIVFSVLANKAVKKDEALVKSVDRLR